VEMIGSSREVLRWLLAAQLNCRRDDRDGEINGFM
jgi:hypothetical protein